MLAVLRSGRLSLGPLLREFERAFAARLGRAHGVRRVERDRRPAPGAARGRRHRLATRSSRARSRFVATANVGAVRAGASGVRRHRPGDAQRRSRRRSPRRHRAHRRAAAGPRVRLPGRHAALEALGLPIVEDACEALGAVLRRRRRRRRARPPGGVRLLRQQAADDRRGRGWSPPTTPRSRSGWTPSATRAARRTWAGSTTTGSGFNYRLSDIACALGVAQLERLDDMLAGRARVAELYREALRRASRDSTLPCPDAGGNRRGWFVFVVQLPREVDRDDIVRALADAAIPSKPVLPGDPPDDVLPRAVRPPRRGSSRSARTSPRGRSRCRSFPSMTEGQVERVAAELRAVLER